MRILSMMPTSQQINMPIIIIEIKINTFGNLSAEHEEKMIAKLELKMWRLLEKYDNFISILILHNNNGSKQYLHVRDTDSEGDLYQERDRWRDKTQNKPTQIYLASINNIRWTWWLKRPFSFSKQHWIILCWWWSYWHSQYWKVEKNYPVRNRRPIKTKTFHRRKK